MRAFRMKKIKVLTCFLLVYRNTIRDSGGPVEFGRSTSPANRDSGKSLELGSSALSYSQEFIWTIS